MECYDLNINPNKVNYIMLNLKGTLISLSLFPLVILAVVAFTQVSLIMAIIPLLVAVYGVITLIGNTVDSAQNSKPVEIVSYKYTNSITR